MRVMYVDDERPAIQNFRLTVANFSEIEELYTFQSGEEALDFAKTHTVDAAFLDMEMPGIHGLGLAKALKEHDSEIRVVFVTAFGQYALEALGVDATGYLLKPYTAGDIRKELAKCTYTHLPSHRLVQTIPTLSVAVDGAPLSIPGETPWKCWLFWLTGAKAAPRWGRLSPVYGPTAPPTRPPNPYAVPPGSDFAPL